MRFIDPTLPSNPNSKLNVMIDGIIDAWQKHKETKFNNPDGTASPINGAAHIVFSFGGFGQQVATNRGFSAKSWMRTRLKEAGIPPREVAFIEDYKTGSSKNALFKRVREGDVTILVGSPKNMGTGVNAQTRLKTLHYGMAPWYPADVEQPHGRILRHGNQNEEVELNWYAAKGTYDETQWQMISRKAKAIEDAMTGQYEGDIEDVSEASQYAMASALASGDPRALRLAELRGMVEKYTRLEQSYQQGAQQLATERKRLGGSSVFSTGVTQLEKAAEAAMAALASNPKGKVTADNLELVVGSKKFDANKDKISEMGLILREAWKKQAAKIKGDVLRTDKPATAEIGKVFGYPLEVSVRIPRLTGGELQTSVSVKLPQKTLSVSAEVGLTQISEQSESGLITRIYSAFNERSNVVKAAETRLKEAKERLSEIDKALAKPFEHKEELGAARAELNQLTLDMLGEALPAEDVSEEDGGILKSVASRNASANKGVGIDLIDGIIDKEGNINYEQVRQLSSRAISGSVQIIRLNEREEQGRIRGGRRNVEASILLGAEESPSRGIEARSGSEQAGKRESRTQIRQRQEKLLEDYAKESGIWYDHDKLKASYKYFASGEEADVYEHDDPAYVIKTAKYDITPSEFLDNRISLFNHLFPETAYELLGFTRDGAGKFRFVLKQPFVQKSGRLTKAAIDKHLMDVSGLEDAGDEITYFSDDYRVNDLHDENILKTPKGNVRVIDAIPMLNTANSGMGGNREYDDFNIRAIPTEGQPLFKKADDRFSESDKLTFQQMQDLQYVAFDDLLEGADLTQMGDRIQANAKSHEIFRRAFEEGRIKKGQTKIGSKGAEDLFAGVFLAPEALKNTSEILREKAQEAKRLGYSADEVAVLANHAETLEQAGRANGTATVYVFEHALPEELFHQADYLGAADKTILNRHSEESKKSIDSHPVRDILWKSHFSGFNEYRRLRNRSTLNAVLRAEIPPYLLDLSEQELADLGITEDQRADYLLTWFEGYAEKNGIDALDYFEQDEINVKEYTTRIRQANAASNTNERRHVEDGGNGQADEADTGKTAEPVGKDRGGKGRDQAEPITEVDSILEPGQRFASLPATLRRAGIEVADLVYDVFGDAAAHAEAVKLIEENGIEGAVRIIDAAQDLDVHHAFASFMIQRLMHEQADIIEETNTEEAAKLREQANAIGTRHAELAIKAGRFIRAASVIPQTAEGIRHAFQGIINRRIGGDVTISPEAWQRLETALEQLEEARTKIEELRKKRNLLQRQVNHLKDGRTQKTQTNRSQLVKQVRAKKASAVKDAMHRLKAMQGTPETLKAVIPMGFGDGFDAGTIDDLSQVAAMMLTEGLAGEVEYLPESLQAEMTAEFGDNIYSVFPQVYQNAWKLRNEWLQEIRDENNKERIEAAYGEELDDVDIAEILGQERSTAARRRNIETLHQAAAGGRRLDPKVRQYQMIIGGLTENNDLAVVASQMASKAPVAEMYAFLASQGLKGSKARQAFRQAEKIYVEARQKYKAMSDEATNKLLSTDETFSNIDDLKFKAREEYRRAQRQLANELNRVAKGEGAYYFGQLMDISNVFRTLMASADMSGFLRQGGFLVIADPEHQAQAFKNMLKSISEKGYGRAIMEIENNPLFVLAQRSGMSFARAGSLDENSITGKGEEVFRGDEMIRRIPLLGAVVEKGLTGWSERTYTAMLDTQSMVTFSLLAQELMAAGYSPEADMAQFRQIAKFINVATGRGNVPSNVFGRILMELPFFALSVCCSV